MSCRDPYITYLKQFGYCVIRLPKADVRPLQVLAKNERDLYRLGELSTLLVGTGPIPEIGPSTLTASISGQKTSSLSLGVGLSILGSVIEAMGGKSIGIDAKYNNAKSISFEFSEVMEDKIPLLLLDQFLSGADLNPLSHHAGKLLEADKLYVTTATIKSKQFTVEAKKESGEGIEVNVPAIQEVVSGNVKVEAQANSTSKVTFSGTIPLVFGFQAVRLIYEDGQFQRYTDVDAGSVAMKRGPSDGVTTAGELLTSHGPFLRMS